MIILSVNVVLQVRKKTQNNKLDCNPPSSQRELTGIPVLSARGLVLCFPPRAHEFGNEFVAFRLRLRLHEHSFISIRFHDFETVSKSMRFGSVYTEPFSPENQSNHGISERFTTC